MMHQVAVVFNRSSSVRRRSFFTSVLKEAPYRLISLSSSRSQWQKKKNMKHTNFLLSSCPTATTIHHHHHRHYRMLTYSNRGGSHAEEGVKEKCEMIHSDTKPIQQQQPEPRLLLCFYNKYASGGDDSELYYLQKEEDHDDIINDGVLVNYQIEILDPIYSHFQLVGSCNGLICLAGPERLCYEPKCILNPLTGEYVDLPGYDLNHEPHYDIISGFGYDQVAKEYKVLRMLCEYKSYDDSEYKFDDDSEVEIYTLGSDKWRKLRIFPYPFIQCYRKSDHYLPQVYVNGALHWRTVHDYHEYGNSFTRKYSITPMLIVAFDMGKEEFRMMHLPPIEDANYYELLELGGYLCLKQYFDDRYEIWVMKEYGVQSSWTKEYVIPRKQPDDLLPIFLLKNGNIVLVSGKLGLISYDPSRNDFKKLKVSNMPQLEKYRYPPWITGISHVPSFISLPTNKKMKMENSSELILDLCDWNRASGTTSSQ